MSIRLSIPTVPKAAKEALLISDKAYTNRLSRAGKIRFSQSEEKCETMVLQTFHN